MKRQLAMESFMLKLTYPCLKRNPQNLEFENVVHEITFHLHDKISVYGLSFCSRHLLFSMVCDIARGANKRRLDALFYRLQVITPGL